ncbi:MAG: SAM-dependent chlorinase/fluorinase [Bacteroidetes bacterium]|nr:SAM-dependent chlorinase/fluorinase [Bacteroidota bacterium]
MPIITLTTDLGLTDYYVGALKGAILSQMPEVAIVDITHNVPAFDIRHGAYVLKQAYPNFPAGTVHIIGINAEASANQNHLAILCDGHYFIGTDNGIFSLLFEKVPDKIYDLSNIRQETDIMIFPLKDIFVKAACHLARGGTPEVLGIAQENFKKVNTIRPVFTDNVLHGTVMYVDSYGNAVANITKQFFNDTIRGKKFTLEFQGEEIAEISQRYNEVSSGGILALFNSAGYLEIAQSRGGISGLYNLTVGSPITIRITE